MTAFTTSIQRQKNPLADFAAWLRKPRGQAAAVAERIASIKERYRD